MSSAICIASRTNFEQPDGAFMAQPVLPVEMIGEMQLLLVREGGQWPGALVRVDHKQVHRVRPHVEHTKPHTLTLQSARGKPSRSG